MAVQDYEKFKLVPDALGRVFLLNELEINLKMYLDWALLQMGGWFDVDYTPGGVGTTNTVFSSAADPGRLRPVTTGDDNYTSGQVWESFRKDWAWETSVDYVSPVDAMTYNPNTVVVYDSGGSTVSSATYSVNYPLGRIIFDSAQDPVNDSFWANHAFRWVQVHTASEAHWFRELQFASFDGDDSHFLQPDSTGGGWSVGSHQRIQLPAVIVEAVARGTSAGYELGNGSLKVYQDVLFHIVAEDSYIRNNLLDTFRLQKDKTLWLFDSNAIADASAWPLTANGDIANSNVYSDLIASGGYRYKKAWFRDVVLEEVEAVHPNLWEGTVRATLEIVVGNL